MGSCVLFFLRHPWPICLSWTSLTLSLTLYSHGLLLTSLGFLGPITSYLSLGFMGLPSIPYSLCFHFFGPATHSYFFSYHTLPMGLLLTISLFLGSFEPICFLKAYLLISWTCDPLFLLLELDGFLFSVSCQLLFVAELGFISYIWVSQKGPSTFSPLNIWSAPATHM